MKISGFSFIKNAEQLYYPIKESILSILPICDEFIIAVGECTDKTRELICSIDSPKIKILDTIWDKKQCTEGMIYAYQTDIAKKACTGDWLFYIQADEVMHEKYLDVVKNKCLESLDNKNIEGLLFAYKHFWGDYNHFHTGHGWYPNEIRIIRNNPDIYSWQDAQSFRQINNYINPRHKEGSKKLNVVEVEAEIFHYGWVRPPHLMQNKKRVMDSFYWGKKESDNHYDKLPGNFDYGPLDRLSKFIESHPRVMTDKINKLDWSSLLQFSGKPNSQREQHKHERLKNRILSFLEKYFNNGKHIGGFRNYNLLKELK